MPEPRWLDAREQKVWRTYLEATNLLAEHLDRRLQRRSGLPHTYYEILVRLSESPERRMRMSELAERALSSRSRLSHAVSRLEEAGWVRREACPTDRRGAFAVLTDEGFAVLDEAARGHVEDVREALFDPLTASDVAHLGRICAKVRDNLLEQAHEE